MSYPDDSETAEKEQHTRPPTEKKEALSGSRTGKDSLIERRSYLKLAGAAVATAATGVGVASANEDYETIRVPSGTIRRINVGSGQTYRNKLFDVRANGAGVKIVPTGSNWTVENIGIYGQHDAQTFIIQPRVNSGSTGTIRNFYAQSYGVRSGGILVQPSHAGELLIENVWLEGFPNNGVYGSPPGSHGKNNGHNGEGRVVIRNSVGANNNVAQFRTGSPNALIENCVMFYNKRPHDYPLSNASVNARGVWNRGYGCTIRDCDIDIPTGHDGADAAILAASNWTHPADAVVTLENTRVNGQIRAGQNGRIRGQSAGSPVDRLPSGVPRSAEEAASGGGATGSPPPNRAADPDPDPDPEEYPNLLEIVGQNDDGENVNASYDFTVSGDLVGSSEGEATQDPNHNVDGNRGHGSVWGGTDAYRFSGDLVEFELDGPAQVRLNGDDADPAELMDAEDHTLTIEDADRSEQANYRFTVSGDLEKSEANDATIDEDDVVDGSSVEGHVWGWKDSYQFTGDLTEFWVDGPVTVTLDGEEVDPSDLMSDLENVLTIEDADRSEQANYQFTVSGDLEKTVDNGATIDDHDVVEDGTATGHVWGRADSYRFSGELTDFEVDKDVTVEVNGEPLDI